MQVPETLGGIPANVVSALSYSPSTPNGIAIDVLGLAATSP